MAGRGRTRGAAVGAVAALAVLGSMAVLPAAGAAPAAAPQAAAVPELDWQPCEEDVGLPPELLGGTFDCATAEVPLDHDDPGGETIPLALKRRKADGDARPLGSLFVNPGGPGGSGVDFVSFSGFVYGEQVLDRFDIIGMDPRGVARSAPLVCFASEEESFDFFRFRPFFPVTPRQERETAELYADYTGQCADEPVLRHMSTADVARDLDLLRAAVGDRRLTYAGYSYGSQLGTTYANLFPSRIRAMVLDGVLDPVAWTTGVRRPDPSSASDLARRSSLPVSTRLRSAEGAHATLRQFFRLCRSAGPEQCALADGDPQRRFERLAVRVLARPVEIPLGRGQFQRVGYGELVGLTLEALYSPSAWTELADFVAEVERSGESGRAGRAYQRLTTRLGASTGLEHEEWPAFQTVEGTDGVMCSDSDNPRGAQAWARASLEADLRAPFFGRPWTWSSLACATWPAPAVEDRYAGPWNARTSAPVLVVGNRYDPATPYTGAQTVARLLPSSRLLTLQGWGHVALGQSSCIDDAVSDYLVAGRLPAAGTVCQPDVAPFTPFEQEVSVSRVDDRTAAREAARREVVRRLPGLG